MCVCAWARGRERVRLFGKSGLECRELLSENETTQAWVLALSRPPASEPQVYSSLKWGTNRGHLGFNKAWGIPTTCQTTRGNFSHIWTQCRIAHNPIWWRCHPFVGMVMENEFQGFSWDSRLDLLDGTSPLHHDCPRLVLRLYIIHSFVHSLIHSIRHLSSAYNMPGTVLSWRFIHKQDR